MAKITVTLPADVQVGKEPARIFHSIATRMKTDGEIFPSRVFSHIAAQLEAKGEAREPESVTILTAQALTRNPGSARRPAQRGSARSRAGSPARSGSDQP